MALRCFARLNPGARAPPDSGRDGAGGSVYFTRDPALGFDVTEPDETTEQRVFRLLFRMLGRRDEAEDMAQEVFVQVFKAIGTFRGDSRLGTWIYRIAVNLCKNRMKYLSRRHAGEQDELE